MEIWSDLDPDGNGYLKVEDITTLLAKLIEKNSKIISSKTRDDLLKDFIGLDEFIAKLSLKLYQSYSCYHFNDILISLSQVNIFSLASRDTELPSILTEYNQINSDHVHSLEDVIGKIDQLRSMKSVQLCKKLDIEMLKFKKMIFQRIDSYNGNIYTS